MLREAEHRWTEKDTPALIGCPPRDKNPVYSPPRGLRPARQAGSGLQGLRSCPRLACRPRSPGSPTLWIVALTLRSVNFVQLKRSDVSFPGEWGGEGGKKDPPILIYCHVTSEHRSWCVCLWMPPVCWHEMCMVKLCQINMDVL